MKASEAKSFFKMNIGNFTPGDNLFEAMFDFLLNGDKIKGIELHRMEDETIRVYAILEAEMKEIKLSTYKINFIKFFIKKEKAQLEAIIEHYENINNNYLLQNALNDHQTFVQILHDLNHEGE